MLDQMNPNRRQLIRDIAILLFITLLMILALALGSPVWADSVRLKSEAHVEGGAVKLKDIAQLDGPDALKLGDAAVANLPDREMTVSLDNVRDLLTKQKVNWGVLSLRGYAKCHVIRADAPGTAPATGAPSAPRLADQPPARAAAPSGAVANPKKEVGLDGPATVKDRVVELIVKLSGADKDDLRITFTDDDAKLLSQPAVGGERFEFEPLSSTGIGRVPITVRHWRGEKLVATERVTADVSRRYLAVVATSLVTRGQAFTGEDVEIKEVYLDESHGTPMAELARVVGQQCTTQLRPGAVVFASSLKSPVLVKRGDLLTVRCVAGSLVVKTTARAIDDGSMDDLIQVRNERSRGTFYVKVTGAQEGLAVMDAPAPAAKPARATPGNSEGAGK